MREVWGSGLDWTGLGGGAWSFLTWEKVLAVRRESRLGGAGDAEFHFRQVCVWGASGTSIGSVWWAVGFEAQARDVNMGGILLLMFETVHPGERGVRQRTSPWGCSAGRQAEAGEPTNESEGQLDHTPFFYSQMMAEVS